MAWIRLTGRAFRNMLIWVARDPLAAIHVVLLSPLRVLHHLIGVIVLFMLAALVVTSGGAWLLHIAKIPDGSLLGSAVELVTMFIPFALVFRALVRPMVMRFGYEGSGGDTHGSARFATRDETRSLDRGDGLLIGRDTRTG